MSDAIQQFTTKIPAWRPYVTPIDLETANAEPFDRRGRLTLPLVCNRHDEYVIKRGVSDGKRKYHIANGGGNA